MKIQVKAKELLDIILLLSKVHNNADTIRSVLVRIEDNNNKIKMLSSGTFGMSQGLVNAVILENDEPSVFIPTTVVPFLQSIGDIKINMDINPDHIEILYENNMIRINQITHLNGVVSEAAETPEWLVARFPRISDILYASENGSVRTGYDVVFLYEDKLITTDRFRMCSYKPANFHIDGGIIIPNQAFKLVTRDSINVGIGYGVVRIGNDLAYTTFNKVGSEPPVPIIRICETEPENRILISKDKFVRNVAIAKSILSKENVSCALTVVDNVFSMRAKSEKGEVILAQEVFDGNLELKANFDIFYLDDIAKSVEDATLSVGVVNKILVVGDGAINHYLLPRM